MLTKNFKQKKITHAYEKNPMLVTQIQNIYFGDPKYFI